MTTKEETVAVLTVREFAALQRTWPHIVTDYHGVLLARIHPRHNRTEGDEEVLARALVFQPPHTMPAMGRIFPETHRDGFLARMTIRTGNVTYGSGDGEDGWAARHIREGYARMLALVLALPVLELSEPRPV